MSPRIILLITNVHMSKSHEGLSSLARKFKINVERLEPGQLLMFLNTKRDKLKIFGPNNVIGYLAMPHGQRISMNAIQYIPAAFHPNGRIDYDTALKASIENTLAKKGKSITAEALYSKNKRVGRVEFQARA